MVLRNRCYSVLLVNTITEYGALINNTNSEKGCFNLTKRANPVEFNAFCDIMMLSGGSIWLKKTFTRSAGPTAALQEAKRVKSSDL